ENVILCRHDRMARVPASSFVDFVHDFIHWAVSIIDPWAEELDRTRLAALSLFTVQSPDSAYSCPAISANTYLAVAGTARYALLAAVSRGEAGLPALAGVGGEI